VSQTEHAQRSVETPEDRLVLWHRATPRAEHDDRSVAFCRKVRTRMEVAGGELLATCGGAVAATFDAIELSDVIELALGIAVDARRDASELDVACAIAHGSVGTHGAAFDRAQLLAHRADAGETVLDEAAAQQAEPTHLFRRELRAGSTVGRVIDPVFDRMACRVASERLITASWPAAREPVYARLVELLGSHESVRCGVLGASAHIAIDRLTRARAELSPPFVLHATRESAGIAPLSSLAVALRRAERTLEALALDANHRAVLDGLRAGAAIDRKQAGLALTGLMHAAMLSSGQPAWLVLENAHELDAASLSVIGDVLHDAATPCAVIATAEEGARIPSILSRTADLETLVLGPLDEESRVAVAAAMLSLSARDALAQRVAELGGDAVLGISQAARALTAVGDIVHDGTRFRFRTSDRRPSGSAPIEQLMLARVGSLPNGAQRVLEAVCVSPIAAPRAFARAIAQLDGLPAEAVTAGFARLDDDGFFAGPMALAEDAAERAQLETTALGPLEVTLRATVRAAMPPARAAELHRFVAEQLQANKPEQASFLDAAIGHHLVEGGSDVAAARALLDAALAANSCGFERVAVRLAAFARKLDGSREMRARASRLAESLESNPVRDTADLDKPLPAVVPAEGTESAFAENRSSTLVGATVQSAVKGVVLSALRAIEARDADAAEAALDTAVTMGLGRTAAGRLWAVALLARGEVAQAVDVLKRAPAGASRARQALTAALILLETGNSIDAVRSALDALSVARRTSEPQGERAALLVLGGCYRRLGRLDEAERLETRALAC
jgi:tetratricopeptide (TPR) repeat protein